MSSDWNIYKMGDVVDVTQGLAINAKSKHLFRETGLPLLRISDLFSDQYLQFISEEEVPKQCIATREELVYTRTGQVGYIFTNKIGVVHNNCFKVTPKTNDTSREFLYWFLRQDSVREHVNLIASGSVQKDLTHSAFKSIEIKIPDLPTQLQIGSILKPLDDRITLLRETNTTLEAIAQALFKSWFVDFDPVHAKQQGREPEGMDANTAALFPDSFEESELGLVPKGWRVGTLGDIANTSRKQIHPTELRSDLHYVGLEHIPRKSLSLINWDNAQGLESAKAAFGEGDILFGKLRPYFHKVVIAPFDGVCSTDILVCRAIQDTYYGVITMHLFSEVLIEYANRLSNGAKMPRVNWKDIAAYPICVPPIAIAEKFSNAVKPLFSQMMANVLQTQTLANLRDTLLPRLISGQLRLPEAL